MSSLARTAFIVIYDLRDSAALELARRHRNLWGRRHTTVEYLQGDIVSLTFSSAGPDWREFEQIRRRWIGEDLEGLELGNLA